MQCKQAHDYAYIKCSQLKFMSLLPLLVCFSCQRILIHLFSSMFLPLCPCPCSTSTSLFQSLPKLCYLISPPRTISILKLLYLCTISPPLSSISIKGVLLIDAKVCIWGRWLKLESCIFYGHHLIVGMTLLVALEIPHIESSTLIQFVGHLLLCHSMGHPFDKLELLLMRDAFFI